MLFFCFSLLIPGVTVFFQEDQELFLKLNMDEHVFVQIPPQSRGLSKTALAKFVQITKPTFVLSV